MRKITFITCIIFLSACTPVSLNGSQGLKDDDVAKFWIQDGIFGTYIVVSLNGNPEHHYATNFRDVPGEKDLVMRLADRYKRPRDDQSSYAQFRFGFMAKAGHSYNFHLVGGTMAELDTSAKLCLYEELHNAAGSFVNFSNEYRTPSQNAKILQCTSAYFVDA